MKYFHYLISILACYSITSHAQANDSYLPQSGSPQALTSHKAISMEKETIRIDVTEKFVKADCWFVFKNNGPATTVRMGFPDDGGYLGPDSAVTGFVSFHSFVNGKEVLTQSAKQNGQLWKVKNVNFPANSQVFVRDVYTSKIGGVLLNNDSIARMAAYTLHTGASWKGNIGQSTVEFQLPLIPRRVVIADDVFFRKLSWAYLKSGGVGYSGPCKPEIRGKTLRFVRTKWRPKKEDDIMLCFVPSSKKVSVRPTVISLAARAPHSAQEVRAIRRIAQNVVTIGGLEINKKPLSDEQMIHFAITWNALRHYSRIQSVGSDGNSVRLPAKYVADCCQMIFGTSPVHKNITDWKYKNGYYLGYAEVFEQLGPFALKKVTLNRKGNQMEVGVVYEDEMIDGLQKKSDFTSSRLWRT